MVGGRCLVPVVRFFWVSRVCGSRVVVVIVVVVVAVVVAGACCEYCCCSTLSGCSVLVRLMGSCCCCCYCCSCGCGPRSCRCCCQIHTCTETYMRAWGLTYVAAGCEGVGIDVLPLLLPIVHTHTCSHRYTCTRREMYISRLPATCR